MLPSLLYLQYTDYGLFHSRPFPPLFSLCWISFYNLPKMKIALLLLYSSILFSRPSALPRQKKKKGAIICTSASPPTPSLFTFIINLHSLAAIYGQFVVPIWDLTLAWYICVQVCRWKWGEKNHTNDIKCVCELIHESSRPVYKACESLFSTAAFHRWRWWLHFIPDDDCNEAGFKFHWALQRDWQKLDTLDSPMLSGHFAPCPLHTRYCFSKRLL